ncbi:MAG: hypothetical protein JWP86_53 [Phenylobacterium sp.]|nr:hypothetical protein [Phenylobacterium sp.]
MHPPYPRAELERRVCERVAAGWTLARLEAEPGFPSRQTVFRWAKEDPVFAARLQAAQAGRLAARAEARGAGSFNEAVAEAMLLRVRRGEAVRDLVNDPAMPGRDQLNRWKRTRPEFAARLDEAWRFSASLGENKRRWRFDEALADRIVARVAAGEPVPKVLGDPAMPCKTTVRQWRKARPEFAAAYEAAKLAGHRARMRARRKLTPALEAEIIERIAAGASLHSLSGLPGMPHHVTLYGWAKRDPDFDQMTRWAAEERDIGLARRAAGIAEGATIANLEQALRGIGDIRKQVGRMRPKRRS